MRPRGAGGTTRPWRVLLRRDERVHAQSIELVDCLRRVIASIGGYFPGDCTDVVDGLLDHRRSLLLIRSLVGGPRAATITW